jgi:predicted ATPase
VLHGLYRFYYVRAELKTAHELGEQCLRLAQSVQDPGLLLEAHRPLGLTSFNLGELATAREHLEQAIALYDPQQHRSHASLYGQDPGVICWSNGALVWWSLGYPDQALERSHEVLRLAQGLSHPLDLAYALHCAAGLHQCRREGQATQERAEELIALSREQGFPYWLAIGTIYRGWALAEQGQGEEGIAQVRQGLAAYRATGSELFRPYHLAQLAGAYGKVGQAEEGLSALAEALTLINKTGERWCEAELYRLKGELMLQKLSVASRQLSVSNPQSLTPNTQHPTPSTQAEACFWKAVEIARKQQAKSLELRAVVSLSRLWQSQGKKKGAHEMLAEIYGWFTEGFDTKDLQEAKALLAQLEGELLISGSGKNT